MPFSRADVTITLINWRFHKRSWERSHSFQEKRSAIGLVALLLKAFEEFAYDGLFLYSRLRSCQFLNAEAQFKCARFESPFLSLLAFEIQTREHMWSAAVSP